MFDYENIESIEGKNFREQRWRKVFESRPEYAQIIQDRISPLGKCIAYTTRGSNVAAAYHASKDFLQKKEFESSLNLSLEDRMRRLGGI